MFNKFFPIVDTCLSCEDTARQSCAMVPRWQFFGEFWDPAFPASRVQHISDLHSEFALGPHHVQKDGRRGKKKKERNLRTKLACGPMPNLMAALPNICGALCSTPQSLANAHYQNAVQ